ncbi:MAG TPA: GNAT family N-acyltransferase [Bryobacteraceae bacterium]
MASATFQSVIPDIVPFRIPRSLTTLLGQVLGIDEIARVYDRLRAMDDRQSITDRLLEFLAVSYETSATDLARLPRSGAAIVTVNHPFGILEGAILASLLSKIRPDVRFLANGLLEVVPELRELLIPVDPISGRRAVRGNGGGLRKALKHLADGGMLVMFPAGEVSHFRWRDRAVTDGQWNPAAARIAGIARAPVVPLYVEGANGTLFQLAGMAHSGLRTALLGRELLNKRGRRVEVRVGVPVPPEKLRAMPTAAEQADYLRWRTYLLATRERFKPRTALPLGTASNAVLEPVAAEGGDAQTLAAEIAGLPGNCLLNRSGDLEVYCARAIHIPHMLHELGRLREITFRAAGEGTGKALDLDEFDAHYLHLFVWNARRQEAVGAYRLAQTDMVRKRFGVRGLYTASLFRYDGRFLDRLGPALEMGRSFVRQEYQKGFAPLLSLWKGIGTFIARNPQYKILFGPVSISNQYEAVSRELMVSFLEKYAMLAGWTGLVRNRRGFGERILKGAQRPAFPQAGFDVEDLSAVVSEMEQGPAGVPVLLRQYLRLGGKLLGFNVDAKFANALDGLILVDLTKTEPKLLERYLGKRESAEFTEFQKGCKKVATWNTLEHSY